MEKNISKKLNRIIQIIWHTLLPLLKKGSTALKKVFTTPDKKLPMGNQKSFVLLLFIQWCLNTLKISVDNTLE